MNSDRQLLPEGLADMPPGPRLGVLLAGVDPARLTASDAEILMQAWYRQMSHDQARFMEAMVQFGLCRPAPNDVVAHDDDPSPSASDEVRASLRWTRQTAERQYYLALDLQRRLPRVHEALRSGHIDMPRARVLTEWTQELTPEQASRICDRLLPDAQFKTTGELIQEIRQLAIAVDPDWVARRYQEAVKTRRVVGCRTADGTANLSGLDLPLDQAAAACANVAGLARRVKTAGDTRPIGQIRADLFLGLLDGTFTGMTDDQITIHLLQTAQSAHDQQAHPGDHDPGSAGARIRNEPGQDAEPDRPREHAPAREPGQDPERDRTGDAAPDREPEHDAGRVQDPRRAQDRETGSERAREGADAPSPGASPDRPDDAQVPAARQTGVEPEAGATSSRRPDALAGEAARQTDSMPGPDDSEAGAQGSDSGTGCSGAGSGASPPSRSRVGVELRVRLSTLLGLDRYPAELAGWGYTHAEHTLTIVRRHPKAQWRYALCDDNGHLLHNGLITARPAPGTGGDSDHHTPTRTSATGSTRAVIEIQIPLTLLQHLHSRPETHPGWAQVIAQIISDLGTDPPGPPPPPAPDTVDTSARPGEHDRPPESGHRYPPGYQDRDRRFPTAPMRRRVQTRDRTCAFPGCRMPAKDTDTDHLDQWTAGGRTQDHNLISLCRHDHRLKDDHGWKLTTAPDGALHWTSPLGLTHTAHRPLVIAPLPSPTPRPSAHRTHHQPPGSPDDQEQPVWDDLRPPPDDGPGKREGEPDDDGPFHLSDDEPVPF